MNEFSLNNLSVREKIILLNKLKRKKQEELEELGKKKEEEEKRIDSELMRALREMTAEEQKEFLEREEQVTKMTSLEEAVEDVPEQKKPSEVFDIYSAVQTKNINIYDLTNYNVYSKVKELAQKAESGVISSEERNFLSGVAYNINRIVKDNPYDSIKKNDSLGYISRTSTILEKLGEEIDRFRL